MPLAAGRGIHPVRNVHWKLPACAKGQRQQDIRDGVSNPVPRQRRSEIAWSPIDACQSRCSFGERLHRLTTPAALRAATAMLLLAPAPPLLFMGQEMAADDPFLFFCDFGADLADAVTQGRRREFARFAQFADDAAQRSIPDPNDPTTLADQLPLFG